MTIPVDRRFSRGFRRAVDFVRGWSKCGEDALVSGLQASPGERGDGDTADTSTCLLLTDGESEAEMGGVT